MIQTVQSLISISRKTMYNFCSKGQSKKKAQYLYGINAIQVALAANKRIFQSLNISDSQAINISYKLKKIVKQAQQRGIPINFVKKQRIYRMVGNQPHQNVILKCSELKPKTTNIEDPFSFQDGVYVYCDKITDPQNFGSILRSCLFFGVKAVFMPKKNSCSLNSTVSKTSAGALDIVDIYSVTKEQLFLQKWKQDAGLIVSTEVSQQKSQIQLTQLPNFIKQNNYNKIIVILGSQGSGVSSHLSKHSQVCTTIARTGTKGYPFQLVDSLNVNAALTCFLFYLTNKN